MATFGLVVLVGWALNAVCWLVMLWIGRENNSQMDNFLKLVCLLLAFMPFALTLIAIAFGVTELKRSPAWAKLKK